MTQVWKLVRTLVDVLRNLTSVEFVSLSVRKTQLPGKGLRLPAVSLCILNTRHMRLSSRPCGDNMLYTSYGAPSGVFEFHRCLEHPSVTFIHHARAVSFCVSILRPLARIDPKTKVRYIIRDLLFRNGPDQVNPQPPSKFNHDEDSLYQNLSFHQFS
jgi:hypothetical protein